MNEVHKKKAKNSSQLKTKEEKQKKRKVLFLVTFFTAVLLTVSTYAWLSSALNVKVKFLEMSVSSDSGLFISLDGIEFSESVTISMDTIITDLKKTYPNHTNQWAEGGLWPVSTNGIKDKNSDKFDVYIGELSRTRNRYSSGAVIRQLNTQISKEEEPSTLNPYISFDVFLKNASGSPFSDNLYFENVAIDFTEDTDDEVREAMTGVLNSVRIGIVKVGNVPHKTDINSIQNMKCNNNCEMFIYDPFSKKHSPLSIATASDYGIILVDGVETPTYASIKAGRRLEHICGHEGTGIPLNTEHFALQNNITDFVESIFPLPNAITKMRVYIWIEGQDIDSLEARSKGADLDVVIDFVKDLAGYEQ